MSLSKRRILDADEARATYDEIVRQLRDPALLEYVGTAAIQANVFPIPPHEERRIELEYSQILPVENGLVRYGYPQSTELYTNLPLDSQSIRVNIVSNEAIRTVYSPSHLVAVDRPSEFSAVVGYEGDHVLPDRDFELFYSIAPDDIGLNLLSYKESGQDGFFLLLVSPSVEVDPNDVVVKDVILVLDTSGSMHGEKLAQVQQAARFVVEHLNPEDRFNIVSFSTGTRSYAPDLIRAAEPGNYAAFIEGLEAIGGTNISQALLEAAHQTTSDRPVTILFLTDGLATEGIVDTPLLLTAVKEALPDNARVFAFGVGDDVDTFLLDSLAQVHRGTTTYVRPGQAIDEAVSDFYSKVSTPILADISLDFGDIVVEQLYPPELPDLFAGSQLVLAGRYREGGATTVTLKGDVNGSEQSFVYEDQTFRSNGGDAFIPRLWATRVIGHLLTQIRLQGEQPEWVQSIVNLSIRYGIITPYTSYLIEENDIFSQIGRQMIIEDAAEELAAPALVSGAAAVDEAAAEAVLAEAEAPLPLDGATLRPSDTSGGSAEVVQIVGAKTFVLRDGVWIDTVYNSDVHDPQEVGFATANYFDLLSAAPALGPYLALGERVLVVYAGHAYEVIPGEGDATINLPEGASTTDEDEHTISETIADIDAAPTAIAESSPGSPTSGLSGSDSTRSTPADSSGQDESVSGVCTGAIIFPLFLGVFTSVFYDRVRRKRILRGGR